MKVENVVIPLQASNYDNINTLLKIINNKNINLIVVNKGNKLNIEKNLYFDIAGDPEPVALDMLWPDKQNMITQNSINNNSMVFKLNYKNFSCLFTGDIEEIGEKKLVQEYKTSLKSTILKVPHHGSKTSSTQEFIKAVEPKISLIGVGLKNKFGHPNQEVIERLEDSGSKVLRTDENGEIIICVSDDGNIKINVFKK